MRKTLIFIGSAPLRRDFSDFIDSCDCVVRFNNCKNYGGNAGTKTDILVLNNAGNPDTMKTLRFMLTPRTEEQLHRELPYLQLAKEIFFARPPAAFLIDFMKTRIQDGPIKENELSELKPDRNLAAEMATSLQIPPDRIHPLPTPEFYTAVWNKLTAFGPTDAFAPSTGMMGIEILLADPRFTGYQKFITGFGWKMWEGHPAELEKQLMTQYSDQNIFKFLSSRRVRLARWIEKYHL